MNTNEVKALLLMHKVSGRVMAESDWVEVTSGCGFQFDKDDFYVVQWNPMTGEWEEEGEEGD